MNPAIVPVKCPLALSTSLRSSSVFVVNITVRVHASSDNNLSPLKTFNTHIRRVWWLVFFRFYSNPPFRSITFVLVIMIFNFRVMFQLFSTKNMLVFNFLIRFKISEHTCSVLQSTGSQKHNIFTRKAVMPSFCEISPHCRFENVGIPNNVWTVFIPVSVCNFQDISYNLWGDIFWKAYPCLNNHFQYVQKM